jgi:branched-chain amino acid transport system permease protein
MGGIVVPIGAASSAGGDSRHTLALREPRHRSSLPALDALLIHLLNGLSAGLLLFLLGAGLTLIFSLMGVLNFAHASFYMLGAYLGQALAGPLGFGLALLLAPLLVGALGALFEHGVLRQVRPQGHVAELLVTFGLAYVLLELVQLIWGRAPLAVTPPPWLQGAAFTLGQTSFPRLRAFMMLLALLLLAGLWLGFTRTRLGLVVQAALTHPQMVEALGHDVPRIQTLVFGGGCALAALAGVVGGVSFVTEPAMAALVGPIIFVAVVVGGLGSLAGAFAGSLLIGLLQTLPLALDASLATLLRGFGADVGPQTPGWPLLRLTLAQAAPILPYLLLVGMLIVRPRGLLGRREG